MRSSPLCDSPRFARNIEAALNQLGMGIGRKVEQRRLQNLLTQWLELEKSRAAFTVLKPEEERLVTVGGLHVRTRVDRIDALATGGEIILDYKTGQVKSTGWDTDRPDEPQLPLYCATSARPISGAAFAVVRTGELGFRQVVDEAAIGRLLGSRSLARGAAIFRQFLVALGFAPDMGAGEQGGQGQHGPNGQQPTDFGHDPTPCRHGNGGTLPRGA